mmetsp:Transcript_62453/g.115994  ORF Transcript_62453/g.115994 Transcript_62453/m.115994 type:complete len:649 (-) Transcript_62453:81-2027(-)
MKGNQSYDQAAYLYLLRTSTDDTASIDAAVDSAADEPDDPELLEEADLEDPGKRSRSNPFYAEHSCTDALFLLIFAGLLVFLGYMSIYAISHGDTRRLVNGFDADGKQCGLDIPGREFLFWCRSAEIPGALDMMHPVCVDRCPSSDDDMGESTTSVSCSSASGVAVADYATTVFAGRYCMPKDSVFLNQVESSLQGKPVGRYAAGLSTLRWAWAPLLGSAGIAVLMGFGYLFLFGRCTKALVWTSMILVVLIPLAGGIGLIAASICRCTDFTQSEDDAQWAFIIGISAVVIGTLFALLLAFRRDAIDVAVGCIEAACECLGDVPVLLLEPVLTLVLKVAVLAPLFVGFVLLLSTGDVESHGTYRTFHYSHMQSVFIGCYFFAILWAWDLCNALSHFVLAYVVQRWYFTPYFVNTKRVNSSVLLDGYWRGVVYHLGTLAFGSAIIACVRFLRVCLAILERQAKASGNCVGACLSRICFACLTCMQQLVEFLNKNAYIEVAVSSSPFCIAAYRAGAVINREIAAVAALNGACWILKLAGLGAIAAVGALAAWIRLRTEPDYSSMVSVRYVQDPVLLTLLAAAICIAIAYTFLTVFDMTCDTVLYCFATERQRQRLKLGAPEMMSSWRPLRRSKCAPVSLHKFLEHYEDSM